MKPWQTWLLALAIVAGSALNAHMFITAPEAEDGFGPATWSCS